MIHAYTFRIIVICSALMFTVPVLCLNITQRAAIQNLIKAIENNTISKEEARKRALSFKLAGTDLNDPIINGPNGLIMTADAHGIPDIFNPVFAAPQLRPVPQNIAVPSVQTPTKPPTEKTAPAEKLPEAQFNALKDKLKQLRKNYKQMSPQEIEHAIDEIKKGFGKVSMPDYMQAILRRVQEFKEKLIKDIATIKSLGTQLFDKELATFKNKLTDPKTIKDLVARAHDITNAIEKVGDTYISNKVVEDAVIEASGATLRNTLYKIIQESMTQAAQLKDYIVLNKLIRKYAYVAQEYPAHSFKHEEKQLQKELNTVQKQEEEQKVTTLKKEIAQVLQRLETNDYYMTLQPEAVDQQIQILENNFDQLTEVQKHTYETILNYQESVYEQLDDLDIIDKDMQDIQKSIAQETITISMLNAQAQKLLSIEKSLQDVLTASNKNSWIFSMLNRLLQTVQNLSKTVYKKEASVFDGIITKAKYFIAENPTDIDAVYRELTKIEDLDAYYHEAIKEATASGGDPQLLEKFKDKREMLAPVIKLLANKEDELEREALEEIIITPALKEGKFPESPGLTTIQSQSEEALKDLLKQRAEAYEREQEQKREQERQQRLIKEDL